MEVLSDCKWNDSSKDKSLVLLSLILIYLIRQYGYEKLLKQRSPTGNILIPKLSIFCKELGFLPGVYKYLLAELRENEIIATDHKLISLKKPAALIRLFRNQIFKKLGQPKTYMFPNQIMKKNTQDKIKDLDNVMNNLRMKENEAIAGFVFHSAFFGESYEIYGKSVKIFSGEVAPSLMANLQAVKILKKRMGLKPIDLKKIGEKGSKIRFPRDISIPGLIMFEVQNLDNFIAYFSNFMTSRLGYLVPELNALLLDAFPVRGLESSERLMEVLDRYWSQEDRKTGKFQLPEVYPQALAERKV